MNIFLTNTFSPLMLSAGTTAEIAEIGLTEIPPVTEMVSAISHEVTSAVLSAVLGGEVKFNRTNLTLKSGDTVFCVCPSFRAEVAREFTREEVENAPIRAFRVVVRTAGKERGR